MKVYEIARSHSVGSLRKLLAKSPHASVLATVLLAEPATWCQAFEPCNAVHARAFVTESPVAHTGTYFHAACLNCMFCGLMIVRGGILVLSHISIYIHIYIYPR